MPKISDEYVRREFLERFARMGAERREGTIEALTVIHETVLAAGKPVPAAPLFEQSETDGTGK
jgi:hypothetical protein